MEIREFAEKVLFSCDLEEKLFTPSEVFTDLSPGNAIQSPELPGRPECLIPTGKKGRSTFPGIHRIESDEQRANLLHFLTNHELIAAELMALVLLKFPNAPSQFRQGVLKTLIEEQHHTLWYLKRMESLGLKFGDQSVNGFIWNHIKSMDEPIDFVSRLSLTFEQANLDYSKFYATRFDQAGDSTTARIFEKIYKDEINHVSHGLYWFRLWKNNEENDWTAWNKKLIFPLSPMRAKGVPFNIEGRQKVGLDESFINELQLFSKSRGRTPRVYFYNPEAESVIAAHGPFHPQKRMHQMIQDLEVLPMYLGSKDDVVLTSNQPSASFKFRMKEAGFSLPQFETISEYRRDFVEGSELYSRKIGSYEPWAWSPDSVALFSKLQNNPEKLLNQNPWSRIGKELYLKSSSVYQLKSFLSTFSETSFLIPKDEVGKICFGLEESLDVINEFRQMGYEKFVVKAPLGSAGGNQLRLWEESISERQKNWINNSIQVQKCVVVEPWHQRVFDFSLQIQMVQGKAKIVGWSSLRNDMRGQFESIIFPFKYGMSDNPELAQFVSQGLGGIDVHSVMESLVESVSRNPLFKDYIGPLGIDSYVYRHPDQTLRLKPLVEWNARYTMGRLALEISKYVQGGKRSEFLLIGSHKLESIRAHSFLELDQKWRKEFPLKISSGESSQIESGYMPLTDPEQAKAVLAVLFVGSTPED